MSGAGRAKGTLVRNVVKGLRKQRELARERLPPHLLHYLDSHILPTEWYPEGDYWELVRAVASLVPGSTPEPLRMLGRLEAKTHLESVYSAISSVKGTEPHRIVQRVQNLWALQHDNGVLTAHRDGEREARITLEDYEFAAKDVCSSFTGYYEGMFEVLNAPGVTVQKVKCLSNKDVCCEWRVHW